MLETGRTPKMIGIEIITGREGASFGPRLADFLNKHPDAKILSILLKGLEGARGLMAVLSYDKKEAPKPKPVPTKTTEQIAMETKKADLQKQLAELS